jgi:hypothetical protein
VYDGTNCHRPSRISCVNDSQPAILCFAKLSAARCRVLVAQVFSDTCRVATRRWALCGVRRHCAALVLCCSLYGLRMPAQTPGGGAITYQMDLVDRGVAMLRYSVRTGSIRIDMYSDTTPDANEISEVFDLHRGTWIVLMPRVRMYVQMPGGRVNRRPNQVESDTTQVEDVRSDTGHVTTTGRAETVAGIVCNDYVGRSNGISYEMCLAAGMGDFIPGVLPPQVNAAAGDSGVIAKSLTAFLRRGVFPLKLVTLRDGKMSTIVATQVSRDAPDSSLFMVPTDYRPMFSQEPPPAPRQR